MMLSSQRAPPIRQNSFVNSVNKMMTGSLSRSLSFGRGSHHGKPLSNHAKDEMNVFASDIVSKEYILDRLKDVKHDRRIVKLEIEDLLIARNHNSFLPVVKALLLTDERPWKYLRFLDTIPSNDFVWWQGMKHCLMREYEATIDEEDMEVSYTKIVSFQANISVSEGATKKSISMLLKNILQDKDVASVSFSGALFGYCDATLPEALTDLMDTKTGLLKEDFAINVKCGWHTTRSNEKLTGDQDGQLLNANPQEQAPIPRNKHKDWVKVLKSCHRVLRRYGDVKPQKPTRQMEDDVMSVVSARDCMSSSAHSHHSTRSADGGRRTGARRTPRRGRSSRSSCSNEHLPIMRDSLRTRRCVTLPVKNGGALRPAPSKRGVPQTRSFHQPRPPVESLAVAAQQPEGSESEKNARPTARRYKSFEMQRPKAGSLASNLVEDKVTAAGAEKKEQDKVETENDEKSGWWADMQQQQEKRQAADDTAIPSTSMRSTPPRRKSGKSKLRRTKSLGSSDHKRRQTAPPDYDWSVGDYVTVMKEKRVVPSAA